MVIVIDTRENTPLFKKLPQGIMFVRDTLKTGDYSIRGFEGEVCIERKSADDFLTSITSERPRFTACLDRMLDYKYKEIIIETTLDKVLRMCKPNGKQTKVVPTKTGPREVWVATRDIHPNVVKGALRKFRLMGIPYHFARSVKDAEEEVLASLKKYYQTKRGE
jgi:ERCC4-type nuclease